MSDAREDASDDAVTLVNALIKSDNGTLKSNCRQAGVTFPYSHT